MMNKRRCLSRRRSAMAIYVYVVCVATLVSLLGLAASAVVRVERRQMSSFSERLVARAHAHSAVELALRTIKTNTSWRTTYTSGVATTPLNLGPATVGSVSWRAEDTDGSIADGDALLRVEGIGRYGSAVQAASVKLQAGVVGPNLLKSCTSGGSTDSVKNGKWWGQYLRPSLPADAHRWWVTSVDIYARRADSDKTVRVRVYRANGSNMPSTEVLDEIIRGSNTFSSSWGWHSISLSGVYTVAAAEGVCLALETTTGGTPIDLEYDGGGVAQAQSALLSGDPGWDSYETDKALRYRVYGSYTTTSGVSAADGTWVWDSP